MKKIVDLVNQMGGVFNITDTSFAPIPKKILANFIDVNNPPPISPIGSL